MSARTLQESLEARGLRCRIEERERLAVVIPTDSRALASVLAAREGIVEDARAAGFTHVAVEVPEWPERAALPRH